MKFGGTVNHGEGKALLSLKCSPAVEGKSSEAAHSLYTTRELIERLRWAFGGGALSRQPRLRAGGDEGISDTKMVPGVGIEPTNPFRDNGF